MSEEKEVTTTSEVVEEEAEEICPVCGKAQHTDKPLGLGALRIIKQWTEDKLEKSAASFEERTNNAIEETTRKFNNTVSKLTHTTNEAKQAALDAVNDIRAEFDKHYILQEPGVDGLLKDQNGFVLSRRRIIYPLADTGDLMVYSGGNIPCVYADRSGYSSSDGKFSKDLFSYSKSNNTLDNGYYNNSGPNDTDWLPYRYANGMGKDGVLITSFEGSDGFINSLNGMAFEVDFLLPDKSSGGGINNDSSCWLTNVAKFRFRLNTNMSGSNSYNENLVYTSRVPIASVLDYDLKYIYTLELTMVVGKQSDNFLCKLYGRLINNTANLSGGVNLESGIIKRITQIIE